jgi:hypothetical protein
MSETSYFLGYSPATAGSAFDPPLSASCIKHALAVGDLVSHRVARQRVILAADLVEWIKSNPEYKRKPKG